MSPLKTLYRFVTDQVNSSLYLLKDAMIGTVLVPPANEVDIEVRNPCIRPPANDTTYEAIPQLDRTMTTLHPIESDFMVRDDYVALILRTEKTFTGSRRTPLPPRHRKRVHESARDD